MQWEIFGFKEVAAICSHKALGCVAIKHVEDFCLLAPFPGGKVSQPLLGSLLQVSNNMVAFKKFEIHSLLCARTQKKGRDIIYFLLLKFSGEHSLGLFKLILDVDALSYTFLMVHTASLYSDSDALVHIFASSRVAISHISGCLLAFM